MTIDELVTLIQDAKWFANLGKPTNYCDFIAIPNLLPWSGDACRDASLEKIADQMEWLPSSRDQDDPIHGHSLEDKARSLGKEREITQRTMDVYKAALQSLRAFHGNPILKVGPHDFSEAARGAALYAVRRAAYEILLQIPSFWCELLQLYSAGHWPCGILPNKKIVIL